MKIRVSGHETRSPAHCVTSGDGYPSLPMTTWATLQQLVAFSQCYSGQIRFIF